MASPNELSFLPDDYLERKAQRRTNAICAVLFLIVMIAIGSAFTITERAVRTVEKEHAVVETQYTEAAKRIQLVEQLQEKQRRMAQQAELAASLLEKVPRSFLLAELTNSLPAGVSLLELSMDSKLRPTSPTANGGDPNAKNAFEAKRTTGGGKTRVAAVVEPKAKAYDVTIRLTGVAYTDVQVAQFIGRLNQSKLLREVNLVISDQYKQGEEQLRKFQIEAQLDPAAQISPGDKPAGATAAGAATATVEIKEN